MRLDTDLNQQKIINTVNNMKPLEARKILLSRGAKFLRKNGSHWLFKLSNGKIFSIPQHTELSPGIAGKVRSIRQRKS